MPRQGRNIRNECWAHIIVRGINRENLFYDREDYNRFISTLKRLKDENELQIAAYCLMSNHVHILMCTGNETYSKIMKKLLIRYAMYYNLKYDRVGHVFQDRYRSEPVEDERHLLVVAGYIYRNPQKAGISVARHYPFTYIQTDGILAEYFASTRELMEFLETENDDKCMEYDLSGGYSDDEARGILCDIIKNDNPQSIQSFNKIERNKILNMLKERGISIRQISRLTGINRNIIQRAK